MNRWWFPAVLAVALAACDAGPRTPIVADNVDILAPVPGTTTAVAYLDITNDSGVAVTITRVASPQFESVAMHETTIEDGVARMRPVERLEIADGETLRLEPGGLHLMLMRPRADSDEVTLDFHSDDLLLLSVSTAMRASSD